MASNSAFVCPLVKRLPDKKKRMAFFLDELEKRYPSPGCALTHKNAFQLLCATILSAQCTDKQVNKVTPELFKKYPTPEKLAKVKQEELEEVIRSTGFFKNKAKNLIAMANMVTEKFGGEIPSSMDELLMLPGVGRKTANVVLGNAFDVPGMVVDTHVMRISNLVKFVASDDPEKIEHELEKQVPEARWIAFSHQVIYLGRELCAARKPLCEKCPMNLAPAK